MMKKPLRITIPEFNELFLASIDEALSVLGEGAKKSIYFHLEQKFHIKKQEILLRLNHFEKALETLFGPGCQPLELMFMQKLHAKVKGKCETIRLKNLTFTNYVNTVKRSISASGENGKNETQADEHDKKKPSVQNTNFLTLLNFLADPVVIVDDRGRFILINNAFEAITGVNKEKEIGKFFLELSIIPAESKKLLMENLKKRRMGLPVEPYEVSFISKSGEVRIVEVKAKFIKYAGQPADLVIFRDITQRKNNERRLKEYSEKLEMLVDAKTKEIKGSEEKFRAMSNSAMDAIVLMDDSCKITYWNPAAERIFGYAKEEVIGKDMKTVIVPPDHREFCLRFAEEVVGNKEENQGKKVEFNALRKDGTEFPVEVSSTAFKLHDSKCLLSIIRDVSEQKKMEAAIKSDLDMLESLTENVGVGFVTISKDYQVLYANKFVRNNTGDVKGKQCYATLNTLDHICPDCGVRKVFEQGVAKDSHEYTQIGVNGKPYYVELIATPIKDKDGNITAALECVVDIAEKKHMQQKLQEYSQKLEKLVEKRTEQLEETQAKLVKTERLAAIGELAGMVGHDLRNPLTSIKGATYFLKTKYFNTLDPAGQMMLSTIDNSIDYSNKIINDLLEYSRVIKLELSETTPKSLLNNAFALLEVPKKVKIIDETQDTPQFKADTGKLSRVFLNIIKNAFDAMPQGGTFTVTSNRVKATIEIIFEDTGTGMSQETLNKLWTPLFTTKAKGMGFGLPICKRIVEAHGGKISVESTPGIGTIFTVTLPVNPKPTPETEDTWILNSSDETVVTTKNTRKQTYKRN